MTTTTDIRGEFADPREINRRRVRSRMRRVCDNSIAGTRHFIEPGELYERIAVIHQGFRVYARCDACFSGWDGYSRYPGSPDVEVSA